MWTSADYELAWPKSVFLRELDALVPPPNRSFNVRQLQWLLEEAFASEQPERTFSYARSQGREGEFVDELFASRGELLESSWFRPYWPRRQAPGRSPAVGKPTVYRRFRDLVEHLRQDGYLDKELTEACPKYESDDPPVDHAGVLAERLGQDDLWPLTPETWDDDTFYGLVEVFHDLVARPRSADVCRADGCIGHYSDFSVDTGRALYRWKVNRLLESSGDELRLADRGEDVGRLVRVTDDPRAELVERALDGAQPEAAPRVAHAIAPFRRRGATDHDKRSAILALHQVLEQRRRLLKASLFRDDEVALFVIANKFDLRHLDEKQHTEHDPAFLDWVFWWYLATVELTDRLLARQRGQAAATAR